MTSNGAGWEGVSDSNSLKAALQPRGREMTAIFWIWLWNTVAANERVTSVDRWPGQNMNGQEIKMQVW